jgi:CubicO group peptidase (beta-lactamase class C family)
MSRAILVMATVSALLWRGSLASESDPSRTTTALIADLEQFIPLEMSRAHTPGIGLALIRNHRIVWERGFGVTNTITRYPVDTETTFPVASLGKPVAAYIALRLAARGLLDLEQPLGRQLQTPWIPNPGHDAVTPRHLLTHTSGLSNFLGDQERRLRFPPGDRFAYSGVGFMYLQRALEERLGSLDSAATAEVFHPLGMDHCSFAGPRPVVGAPAYGHIRVDRACAPFAIIFLPLTAILLLIALTLARVTRHRWALGAWALLVVVGASAGGTLWFLYSRAANPRLVPFFAVSFVLFVALASAVGVIALLVAHRLGLLRFARLAWGHHVLTTGVVAILLFALIGPLPIPVPDAAPREGNAASSLRASAGDLARFALEAARPTLLPPELGTQFSAAQVPVDEHIAWGLGIGVQTSPDAHAVFHWGRNPAVRAAMVMYLDRGDGVVILANDGRAGDAVRSVALRAVGTTGPWADH